MKNKVYIADGAFSSALGNSWDADFWENIYRDISAAEDIDYFDTSRMSSSKAAFIRSIHASSEPNIICRLMKPCLARLNPLPPSTFIIWASAKDNAEFIERKVSGLPTDGILSSSSDFLKWLSAELHTSGAGTALNAACASSSAAIAMGAGMIESGFRSSVLVCAADWVSRFIYSGFSALHALSSNAARPFDETRDGLIPGEASVALLLMNEEAASAYQSSIPKSLIRGWGISNDANHITGPARDACGLVKASESAMKMAGITASEISFYSAHGTATRYNDSMELTAIEKIFGARELPVFSVKGALGHCFGACGALETIISVMAMQKSLVPPSACCIQPEKRAVSRVSNKPSPIGHGSCFLKTNSGFGGVNAALVVEKL